MELITTLSNYSLIYSVLIAYVLIIIFYKLFQISWPDLYFSADDIASYSISISPLKYLAFRLAPVFIIVCFVLGTTGKKLSQEEINKIGLLIGLLYTTTTHGVAIVKLLVGSKSITIYLNKYFQYFYHFVSIIFITLSCYIAALISKTEYIADLTPSLSGLVDNIWSSIITALLAVYIYKIYQGNNINTYEIIDRAYKKIPANIVNSITDYCMQKNADATLVMAICIVESIQRPLWIRRVEWLKSLLFKHGSYGIMQVEAEKFVKDEESIKIAVDRYFANKHHMQLDELRALILSYNRDERYTDLVLFTYSYIQPFGAVG